MAGQFTYADLSYLESMSMGSQEMVIEMIQIFLDQIPEFTQGFNELLENEDFNALGALAHKAKSSVSVMGMTNLAEVLKDLELKAKAGLDMVSYQKLVNIFLTQIDITEKEMLDFISES